MKRHHFFRHISSIAIVLILAVTVFLKPDMTQVSELTELPSLEQPLTGQLLPEDNEESTLEIHFIDVGQGDATLFMCDGEYMLLDTGDNNKGTLVQNYLQKRGIENLKYLVLTHPDADHIGAAPVIITKFDIENIFMSAFEKSNKTYERLLESISYRNYVWSTPEVGSTYTLGGALITIIAPNAVYTDPNNASIALKVTHGENTFLFTGDAGEEAENDMLMNGMDLSATVYQVGHHGSKTSSSDAFLDAVHPEFAVISCAEQNSYGHPHAATLNKLRSMGVKVYRTDEQGSIVAVSDKTNLTWSAAPSDSWKSGE